MMPSRGERYAFWRTNGHDEQGSGFYLQNFKNTFMIEKTFNSI